MSGAREKVGLPPNLSFPAITPLRLLALKTSKPAAFASVMSMEANLALLREREQWAYLLKFVVVPVVELQLEDVTREEVEHVVGAILSNTFEVMVQAQVQPTMLIGLFFEPALMNHDCVANTRLTLDSSHRMTVMTSVAVKKNEQIKFNYLRALDPTLTRQVGSFPSPSTSSHSFQCYYYQRKPPDRSVLVPMISSSNFWSDDWSPVQYQ